MRGIVSSPKTTNHTNNAFVVRLIEVCGTSEPSAIQRLLNISYQAAKNYLTGRVPDTKVLLQIAEKTPFSIHWLLTGKGDKIAKTVSRQGTTILSDQMRELIRQECVEIVGNLIGSQNGEPKVVVLEPAKIRSEKVSAPEPTNVEGHRFRT